MTQDWHNQAIADLDSSGKAQINGYSMTLTPPDGAEGSSWGFSVNFEKGGGAFFPLTGKSKEDALAEIAKHCLPHLQRYKEER